MFAQYRVPMQQVLPMTRRELARGCAAALVAAPVLVRPAPSKAAPYVARQIEHTYEHTMGEVSFAGHPLTGVADGGYFEVLR